ncbi:hypothetical protein CL617_03375 [archaeon]|nr:hypothetical protein [archaeon]|tara:strand:- start:2122 stop:2316 length:195 start_codon:yes stop_codon:yes gene_type:complete
MVFKQENRIQEFGENIGYLFSYFLFTTVLFFILSLTNRGISYFYVMVIVLVITLFGVYLKRILR